MIVIELWTWCANVLGKTHTNLFIQTLALPSYFTSYIISITFLIIFRIHVCVKKFHVWSNVIFSITGWFQNYMSFESYHYLCEGKGEFIPLKGWLANHEVLIYHPSHCDLWWSVIPCTQTPGPVLVVAVPGCIAGYKQNGGSCDICPPDTYNAADDTSTTCSACEPGTSTGGNTGQAACTSKWHSLIIHTDSSIMQAKLKPTQRCRNCL